MSTKRKNVIHSTHKAFLPFNKSAAVTSRHPGDVKDSLFTKVIKTKTKKALTCMFYIYVGLNS